MIEQIICINTEKNVKFVYDLIEILKVKKKKKFFVLSSIVLASFCISACSSNNKDINSEKNKPAIYLRGEMNDYAVSETYRLREDNGNLCTLATLRSDWSPYKFKFADANWTSGTNFGYLTPPGVLRPKSGPLKLNPNSRFEELRFYPQKDGVYKFCLIKRGSDFYVTVDEAEKQAIKTIAQVVTLLK